MDTDFLLIVLVGFLAQMIDGALGMAYGVLSTSFLLSLGLPPASASASVHLAEVFTTGASGVSHLVHRNVDRHLLLRLAPAGVVGGAVGAYILTEVPGEQIKPVIALYLVAMGLRILWKAFARPGPKKPRRHIAPLGLVGGFLDAIGGGGWGPIVTSTLIARGETPRYVIGSVNLAEFFMTASASAAFLLTIGMEHQRVVLGLLIGGIAAAPLAAYLVRWLPARAVMIAVALTICTVSFYTIVRSLS